MSNFIFVSAAEKARLAAKSAVDSLLNDLAAAGVAVTATLRDTAPRYSVTRQEVSAGYGRWEKSDTVMVFAGRPEPVDGSTDSKDAGWATAFSSTFRDDDREVFVRGSHSKCVVFEFSCAAAVAAGVAVNEVRHD